MTLWIVDAQCDDYQPTLDVPRLAREGYSALVVKATQGATGYTASARFNTWRSQARDSGLIFGAYHWLTNASPTAQVDHFLNRIGNPSGLLIQLDVEDTSNPPSWATLTGWVTEWNKRTNHHPLLIYTGAWWWMPRGWNGASLTPYLWHSHYALDGAQPAAGFASVVYDRVPTTWWSPGYGGWAQATILQFTSRGTAGGITANVDVNAFTGNVDQLRILTGATPQEVSMLTSDQEAHQYGAVQHTEHLVRHLMARTTCPGAPTCVNEFDGALWWVEPQGNVLQGPPMPPVAVTVTMTDSDRHAIVTELAGLLASQFRTLSQVAERLGVAGDALGTLNDA